MLARHAAAKIDAAIQDFVAGQHDSSHLIGIAFDGYPIYGDRDITGRQLTASDLDQCSGITSATPEFPQGTYHYVLLSTANSSSSIRCFSGKVTISASMAMPSAGMNH